MGNRKGVLVNMLRSNKSTNSTSIKKKAFLKVFKSKACNISAACDSVPIDRTTYYLWMEKDKKFNSAVIALQESLLDFSESMLMKNIQSGKEASIFFHLKTKGKKRGYIERQEIDHSGKDLSRPTVIQVIAPVKPKGKKK